MTSKPLRECPGAVGIRAVIAVALLRIGGFAEGASGQGCDPIQQTKLLVQDGSAFQYYGYTLALFGPTMAIGAPGDQDNGGGSGAVYVYRGTGSEWAQEAKLHPLDGHSDHWFGWTVALSDDVLIAGATSDNTNGTGSGAAYVFRYNGSEWGQEAKLVSQGGEPYNFAGSAVAIDGNTAMVGAPRDDYDTAYGKVYVFEREDGVWIEKTTIWPSFNEYSAQFGSAIALVGDLAVIGAPWGTDFQGHSDCGNVFVFRFDGSQWVEEAILLASDRADQDQFGYWVDANENTIVVGAPWDDDQGDKSGSVYIFQYDGNSWVEYAKLLPSDGTAGDGFGDPVAIFDDALLVGASGSDDHGSQSGAAYLFRLDGTQWLEESKITVSDGASEDWFGGRFALGEGTAVIASPGDDDNGRESGSAYVFDLGCNDCPPDLNGDGLVNTQDFVAFLNAWASRDPLADWDENGVIDTRDFVAYLNDWAAGC